MPSPVPGKRVSDEILLRLSRNRLKELCRAVRPRRFRPEEDGPRHASRGTSRRVVSPGIGEGGVQGRWRYSPPPAASRPAAEASESRTDVLSVAQLEQYLWSAADILRGSIDSSDYKTYIFGLLFLKRLSDRFEEEAEKLIAEGVLEDVAWTDPDEHQFFVPDRARWTAIQKRATNIGERR